MSRRIAIVALVWVGALGCDDTTESDAPGQGGRAPGGAGARGTLATGGGGPGGASAGTGGAPTGGVGGSGTGGTSEGGRAGSGAGGPGGAASICPPGSESLSLDLSDKAPSPPIAGMPPAGYPDSFNLEGPVWIGDALYASEIAGGVSPNPARILEYVPGGSVSVFLPGAGTNGLAVNPDGDLVAARQLDGTVSVLDIDDPTLVLGKPAETYDGARFNSPNDLALSSTGHLYFTDPDWQAPNPAPQDAERAYHVPPGGVPAPIGATPSKPNGVTLSLDETTLWITGTDGLMYYSVATDGTVGSGTTVTTFIGGGDGMGMDCAGNLYVTNGDKIVVFDANGAKYDEEIEVGASVTNVAFGGPDRKTLFITSLSPAALREIAMDIAGLPY